MTLAEFLRDCAELERLMKGFYETLRERFPGDADACELFSVLAAEEENHERQLAMLRVLSRQVEGPSEVHPRFHEGAEGLKSGVEQVRRVLAAQESVSLRDAVEIAARIEGGAIEAHRSALIKVPDADFQRVMSDLAAGDERHRQKIQRFRRRRWPEG